MILTCEPEFLFPSLSLYLRNIDLCMTRNRLLLEESTMNSFSVQDWTTSFLRKLILVLFSSLSKYIHLLASVRWRL